MSSRHNARRAAVQALYQWDLTSQAADQIEKQFQQIHDMQNIDRKYLREILSEVPRLEAVLEQSITLHIDRDFAKLDPIERAILRIGAYELTHRPDVPTKVVINEMIELAKVFGSDHSYKFVNGVIDKMAKTLRPVAQSGVSKSPTKTSSRKKTPAKKATSVGKITAKKRDKQTNAKSSEG